MSTKACTEPSCPDSFRPATRQDYERHSRDIPTTLETYRLSVQQFFASKLLDLGLAHMDVQITGRFVAEDLAYALYAMMKVPADVLQQDRVIAEYPDGLWQTVRAKLGWKHRKHQVRFTEMLLFPQIEIPRGKLFAEFKHFSAVNHNVLDYRAANEDFV